MSYFIPSTSSHGNGHKHTRPSPARTTTYTYGSTSRARKPSSPASSFFSTAAPRSLFGGSTSYYKRRPRDGYISRLIAKIRRLLRDLYRYIRKNPVKVLLPILSLLVSTGVFAGLARGMGLSLPQGFRHLVGMGEAAKSVRGGYDAWYGSQGGGGGGGGGGEWLGSALKMAQAFV